MITMELSELKNICMDVSELAVANYVKKTKPGKDLISQREAYKLFHEARVKRWLGNGMLTVIRSGGSIRSKVLYSMAELIAMDNAERMKPIINKIRK